MEEKTRTDHQLHVSTHTLFRGCRTSELYVCSNFLMLLDCAHKDRIRLGRHLRFTYESVQHNRVKIKYLQRLILILIVCVRPCVYPLVELKSGQLLSFS